MQKREWILSSLIWLDPCYESFTMTTSVTTLPIRPPAKTRGEDAPTPRAAMALAKSKAYQDAADAPATLRAYATDWANFNAWCTKHGFTPMPATPEVVGAFLAAAGEGYALPTLPPGRSHCPYLPHRRTSA